MMILYMTQITCKLLNVSRGGDMDSQARALARHFQQQGSPVMMGILYISKMKYYKMNYYKMKLNII